MKKVKSGQVPWDYMMWALIALIVCIGLFLIVRAVTTLSGKIT